MIWFSCVNVCLLFYDFVSFVECGEKKKQQREKRSQKRRKQRKKCKLLSHGLSFARVYFHWFNFHGSIIFFSNHKKTRAKSKERNEKTFKLFTQKYIKKTSYKGKASRSDALDQYEKDTKTTNEKHLIREQTKQNRQLNICPRLSHSLEFQRANKVKTQREKEEKSASNARIPRLSFDVVCDSDATQAQEKEKSLHNAILCLFNMICVLFCVKCPQARSRRTAEVHNSCSNATNDKRNVWRQMNGKRASKRKH